MLNPGRFAVGQPPPIRGQRGIVLYLAIIILVIMTLAGIALVRSIDTSTIIAGNLAFQQSATHSADTGVETAIAWLQANSAGVALDSDDPTNGYAANGLDPALNPAAGQSWDAFWAQTLAARARTLSSNGSGNTVSYVIDRLCALAGAPASGANCAASQMVEPGAQNENVVGGPPPLNAPSRVYYRITARVAGPRSTVSYVQSIIAL